MKKLTFYLMSLLLFAGAVGLAACGDDDPEPVIPDPTITITNVVPTQTTISFSLTPKNAESYKYACVETGKEPTYTEVKSKDAQDFTVRNLKENTAYQIIAIAYNKTKESPKATKDTKTLEKDVEVATVAIGTITADTTSAKIVITPSANATSMKYAVYLATAEVAESDWVTVTDFHADNTYEVTGLKPNTVYKVEAYALLNEAESVHVSKDFTTLKKETPVVNDKLTLTITDVTATNAHVAAALTAEATAAGYQGMYIGRSTKEEYNAETIVALVNDGRTNMPFKKQNYDGNFSDLFDQASTKPEVVAEADYIVWAIPTTGSTDVTVDEIVIKEFKMAPGGVPVENVTLAVTEITANNAHVAAALTAEATEAGYQGIFIGRSLKADYNAQTVVTLVSNPHMAAAFKKVSFDGNLSDLYDNFGEKPAVEGETDYIVWVIPGKEGEAITADAIVTKELKTLAASGDDIDPNTLIAKFSIGSITETDASITVELSMAGNGLFLGAEPTATFSAESVIAKITGPNADDHKIDSWSAQKKLSDYCPDAQPNTSYTIWLVPCEDGTGNFSKDPAKVVTKTITTIQYTYDGISQVTGEPINAGDKSIVIKWTPDANTFQYKTHIFTAAEAAGYANDVDLAKAILRLGGPNRPSEEEQTFEELTPETQYVACAVGYDKIGGNEEGQHLKVGKVTRIEVATTKAIGTSNASVEIETAVAGPNFLKFNLTPTNGCTQARVLLMNKNDYWKYPYQSKPENVEKALKENTAAEAVVLPINGVTEFISSYKLKYNSLYHIFVLPLDNNNGAGPMVSKLEVGTATNFVLPEGAPGVTVEILDQQFERQPAENQVRGTVTLTVKFTPAAGVKRYFTGKVATADFNSPIKKNTVFNTLITSTNADAAYIVGENGADAPEVTRTISYFELNYVPTNKVTIAALAQNAADEFSKSGAEVVYPDVTVE